MNEQEKSLKLAELMGWGNRHTLYKGTDREKDVMLGCAFYMPHCPNTGQISVPEPYAYNVSGLSQFAAIILKHPYVIERFCLNFIQDKQKVKIACKPFTRANILDEILRMNGINPDA